MKKNILLTLSLLVTVAGGVNAQTPVFSNPPSGATATRIPAITMDKSGNLVAFADKRYGTGDIGSNSIDIVARTSSDNGTNWETPYTAVLHTSNSSTTSKKNNYAFDFAHGDAAVVTDRETGKMLLMCASGSVSIGSSTNTTAGRMRVGRYYSTDKGVTWTGSDITSTMYGIWGTTVKGLFFSSGRICQSRFIKVGSYYRLYASVNTTSSNLGSLVVYSDDFGETWSPLGKDQSGNILQPAVSGDEAKCEELPNGNVLLSSRMSGGRYFNIFTYTTKSTGVGYWGTPSDVNAVASNATGGTVAMNNSTNGEILIVPAKRVSDGKELYVALQSVPFGGSNGRENVGIYYKVLASRADFDQPSCFQSGWKAYPVSTTTSAYSTMVLDKDGNIAFLYEENAYNNGYDIQFKSLPLSIITNNAYTYNANLDNEAFLNPLVGKIFTLKCSGVTDNTPFSYYIYDDVSNTSSETKLGVKKATEVGTAPTDYKYYWVVSRDPDGDHYYMSAFQGDGYLGTNYAKNVFTGTLGVIPGCTDDYTKEFQIVGFSKAASSADYKKGDEMTGLAIEFYNTEQKKDKWVAVAEDGEINWFDHTTLGTTISTTSKAWTTDFVLTEVAQTSTIGDYGTFATPTQFGFPVKMTRSDDNYTVNTSIEDYDLYATLKLPFATTLPTGVKAYKITSLQKPNNSVVELTQYLDGEVLPRETPVLLRKSGAKGDGIVQTTIYLQPTLAKTIVSTGFNGTLGAKTFATTVYDYTTNPHYYVLGKEKGRVAFYYLTSQTIGANKAYYIYTGTAAPAKSLSFAFTDDDATTAIELPNTTTTTDANAPIYDLSGRRVTSPTKGIYIQGGKKFVVK